MLKLYSQLLHNRVLSDGEARHYSSWEYPTANKLHQSLFLPDEQTLQRRPKLHAPLTGGRRGLRQLLHGFRFR